MNDWKTALGEMEQSIAQCLESLDRYEQKFGEALAQEPASRPEPAKAWDAKLDQIARTHREIESLLAEQDMLWQHWSNAVSRWHGLIEQPA